MPLLTLVPAELAAPGYVFVYQGDPGDEACDGCAVRDLCYRLEPGRRYRVSEVRDVSHPCGLHDEDRVKVCTVEPAPLTTTLLDKRVRGTAATWDPIPCGYPECPNNPLCHPVAPAGSRHEIIKDHGVIDCPMGHAIRKVTLRPL